VEQRCERNSDVIRQAYRAYLRAGRTDLCDVDAWHDMWHDMWHETRDSRVDDDAG
jgi:hypothetical protein